MTYGGDHGSINRRLLEIIIDSRWRLKGESAGNRKQYDEIKRSHEDIGRIKRGKDIVDRGRYTLGGGNGGEDEDDDTGNHGHELVDHGTDSRRCFRLFEAKGNKIREE